MCPKHSAGVGRSSRLNRQHPGEVVELPVDLLVVGRDLGQGHRVHLTGPPTHHHPGLVAADGDTKARGLGTRRVLDVDTVVFCIGDRVDEKFGLPVKWNEFVKNPHPAFPVDGVSYEAFDPQSGQPIKDVFVAGWSREASSGLVGIAKKDGENGARALNLYLQTVPVRGDELECLEALTQRIRQVFPCVVNKEDVFRLEELERQEAERRGLEFFKYKSNEEMLAALQSDCPFAETEPVKAEPASSHG